MKSKSPHRARAGLHATSPIDLTDVERPSQGKGKGKEQIVDFLQQLGRNSYLSSPRLSSRSSPSQQLSQEQTECQLNYHHPPAQFVEQQQPQQTYPEQLVPPLQQQQQQQQQQQYYEHMLPQIPYPGYFQPQQPYFEPPSSQNQLSLHVPQLQPQGQQQPHPQAYSQEQLPIPLDPLAFSQEPSPCPPRLPDKPAHQPEAEQQECQKPKCQQLRLRIRLLELTIQGQCIPNLHHSLPTLQQEQQQLQLLNIQNQDSTAGDISTDDEDGSEHLKLGMQRELQEHMVQMQIQNSMPIHRPIPVSVSQPALLAIPTPTFTPTPQQGHNAQPSTQLPTQIPIPIATPMQVSTPVPSHASSQSLPQIPTQVPPQPKMHAHLQGPSQLPAPTLTPVSTPIPPPVLMQMHVQLPEQVPRLPPSPCCSKTCTTAHLAWPDVLTVDANGSPLPKLEAFDFTTVLFEKYDRMFDRLAVIDVEMAHLGYLQKPRVPVFKRKANRTPSQSQKEATSTICASPGQPSPPEMRAAKTSTAMPPRPVPSPSRQSIPPSVSMTDAQYSQLFQRTRARYLYNVERMAAHKHDRTMAAERGQTVEEVEKEPLGTTNSFAYKCSFLKMHRRRIVELWTERNELLGKLSRLERELAQARENGLMPWAKDS